MLNERRLTIREAYVEASSFLRGYGVREPESNAQRLLEYVLEESRTGLLLRWSEPFPERLAERWQQLLERKAAGEPVQYMIGEQEFYGLPFRVSPAVLIPRPETELLVEELVRLGKRMWPETCEGREQLVHGQELEDAASAGRGTVSRLGNSPTVCDIGTGSGAIAVTIATQCPGWRVLASDLSEAALKQAQHNAELNGVADRIEWSEGDLLQPWIERAERIDLLVSNPPYIPDSDENGLQPEVRLYEPHMALFGGADGLTLYRRMVAQLHELPQLPRVVGFEVGQGQAEAVRELLLDAAEWDEVYIVDDLAGIGRHVIAYRS
ncbi:peptide chain release factor N(5)-glutamine methyltransferase [Paenibacillus sp. YYML68]|uniref:peptide chain release factor N(5)-glutamine methyltransferase n=1 Tax=Paenibacillus sp. YYML68 TaxID=2909250 RepID=UPI0024924F2A|nr:peptide chain release factor N(5)-glutamine methyltransferase [Paenibacillus sp. YYML68]